MRPVNGAYLASDFLCEGKKRNRVWGAGCWVLPDRLNDAVVRAGVLGARFLVNEEIEIPVSQMTATPFRKGDIVSWSKIKLTLIQLRVSRINKKGVEIQPLRINSVLIHC